MPHSWPTFRIGIRGNTSVQHVIQGYRGLRLLFNLNWDRLVSLAIIFGALFAGAAVIELLHSY